MEEVRSQVTSQDDGKATTPTSTTSTVNPEITEKWRPPASNPIPIEDKTRSANRVTVPCQFCGLSHQVYFPVLGFGLPPVHCPGKCHEEFNAKVIAQLGGK